jgi:hypothetical protein
MSRDFYRRFDLSIKLDEARRRFVNRAKNVIFEKFIENNFSYAYDQVRHEIITALGERVHPYKSLDEYIGNDFFKCLTAIEAAALPAYINRHQKEFDQEINALLLQSEVDLEIRWKGGKFHRTGAKLLDDELVNKSLHWLGHKKYETVLTPFSKGLEHFLHSKQRPELLSDVITDMYEALEALAKIVTGKKEKDLTANRELFLKEVKASNAYKVILKEYITYAQNFRHAAKEGEKRPTLSEKEVESFVYLTAIFIRLASAD